MTEMCMKMCSESMQGTSDGLSVDNHSFYTDPASDPVSCTWFFVGLDDQQNLGRCHQSCWAFFLMRMMAFLLMRLRISFAWTWFHQHGRCRGSEIRLLQQP